MMTRFSPPRGWVKVDQVCYPGEDTGWSAFWIKFGPHISCFTGCLEELARLVQDAAAQGVCVEPEAPPPVSMGRVQTLSSDHPGFIRLGACQACGTVYWADDGPLDPETIEQEAS